MRKRIVAILAYAGAGLTLVIAVSVPFYLMGAVSNSVAAAGLHVDAVYNGGSVARTITQDGYSIAVHEPVRPRLLQRFEPFVQVDFLPVGAPHGLVSELVDLDGDGQPDVKVTFAVPTDPREKLYGDVLALNGNYLSLNHVSNGSFSRMVARAGERIVVRVPLKRAAGH
jgi:hypothetical protein